MGRLFAVEIVYRGIFQKTLAKNISRAIVLAAHREGKPGISFGRYGDSPERNGIPAKNFAIVGTDDETLEKGMAKYEPKEVDITIAVDDTLLKGVESWAWYGLQPINRLLKPGGTLIVTSKDPAEKLIPMIHRKEQPYRLAIVKGIPSFSGLWVYKDDHTDVRILGAIAKLLPELVGLESVLSVIEQEWHDPVKAASATRSAERVGTITVAPNVGNPEKPFEFEMPKWWEMREGVTIPGIAPGRAVVDAATGTEGGFRPERNPVFKKYTTRSMRPVIDFETCTKCTLCWLQCPDSCYDVMPDGLYDADMLSCCGCGVCEAVCPVPNCITMVYENQFQDNASQWQMYKKDPKAYKAWVQETTGAHAERTHGFRYRGQYQEQVPEALKVAGED
jgi:pyruvate ferredoxin oxidoreductase delta subunit